MSPSSQGVSRIGEGDDRARLIAKIVREVLRRSRFQSPSDLREAIEARCAELRIAFTRDQIERAMDLVGSNASLLQGSAPKWPARVMPDRADLSAVDARRVLSMYGIDVSTGVMRRCDAGEAPASRQKPV